MLPVRWMVAALLVLGLCAVGQTQSKRSPAGGKHGARGPAGSAGAAGATGATGPTGPTGVFDYTQKFWSPVDMFAHCRNSSTGALQIPAAGASGEKDGHQFYLTAPGHVTGVRFYWNGGDGEVVRVGLSNTHTSANLATVDVTTSGGSAVQVGMFATPVAIDSYLAHTVWMAQQAGTKNIQPCSNGLMATNGGRPTSPFIGSAYYVMQQQLYGTGGCVTNNACSPGSALGDSSTFPVEAIITVP